MKCVVGFMGKILRRGYALLFAFVFIFYIIMAVVPALLMVDGHPKAGQMIYRGFHFLCHQYPWRSWFLGGEQSWYPLEASDQPGIIPFEEAAGQPLSEITPRNFFGNPVMGYKMAVCQRDTAIYGAMAVFSLLFVLSRNRIPRVDWRLWAVFGILPMAADGLWQLVSQILPPVPFRESTPFVRTVTGALFGFFTCWYLLPTLEQSLMEGEKDDRQ